MSLGELATEVSVPVGTRIFVEEDGIIYTSVGQTRPEIASRLGWTQPNIWLPSPALRDMRIYHEVIVDHINAAALALQNPFSVHEGRDEGQYYFFLYAELFREAGLLTSRSTRFIDAVVQLRETIDGSKLLRLFHLSPATRNKGGRQLWP